MGLFADDELQDALQDGARSAASTLRDSLAEAKSRLEQG